MMKTAELSFNSLTHLDVGVGQDGPLLHSGRGFKGGGGFLFSKWAGGGPRGRAGSHGDRAGAGGGRGEGGRQQPEARALRRGQQGRGGQSEVGLSRERERVMSQ